DQAVHGVVEDVVGLGDAAVLATPEGDRAGDVADQVDVEEQPDGRQPADVVPVPDQQTGGDGETDQVLGAVQAVGGGRLKGVCDIHDLLPHNSMYRTSHAVPAVGFAIRSTCSASSTSPNSPTSTQATDSLITRSAIGSRIPSMLGMPKSKSA